MLCKDALGAYNPLAPCGKYAIFDRKDCVLVFLVLSLHKTGFTSAKRSNKFDALLSVRTIFAKNRLHLGKAFKQLDALRPFPLYYQNTRLQCPP